MPRIFVTGITGLIGGDYLHILSERHADWEVVGLVRDEKKARVVEQHYPFVKIVHGSLDDIELLEAESEKADVVLNFANCDHLPAAEAIVRGLSRRTTPGYVIHTSGAKIIAWEMEANPNTWGKYMPRPYNDWTGVRQLTRVRPEDINSSSSSNEATDFLPDWAAHRDVDLAILEAHRKYPGLVRTAIVCPPTVYGPSRFPLPTRSIQLPRLLNVYLRRRQAFTIKQNKNVWNMIHTQDISEMYVLLTEAAVEGREGQDGQGLWDEDGYYFAEQGQFVWGEVIQAVTKLGYQKGYFDSPEPESLTQEQVFRFWYGGHMNMSTTSLGSAQRVARLLGWKPSERSIFEDLERTLDHEASLLGLA
ncbi:hypothetical protein AbraIFM66951_006727 [Aspergillus brasiliensis]|uniref:NAD-dependent epimerase/dehydratase domain-containing protein n=1 Tax=Aspergillus brasiliensis TaxID=319629 RepID=A0A9W6DN51_9EURO|nr:hypothetical protein AbraCBS73388_007441 [Aspergillus brasiliensis]GKZ44523.1 hypothetical protein AbraIFM66951_006727 [Aspergillus brasiliensis]